MPTDKPSKFGEGPFTADHEVENSENGIDAKKATAGDRADMWRLGKTQELTVRPVPAVHTFLVIERHKPNGKAA